MRQPKKSRKSLAFTGESGSNVVYLNPSGNVIVRIPRDDQTKTLVKNLACENWREVSNAILQHAELAPKQEGGGVSIVFRYLSVTESS